MFGKLIYAFEVPFGEDPGTQPTAARTVTEGRDARTDHWAGARAGRRAEALRRRVLSRELCLGRRPAPPPRTPGWTFPPRAAEPGGVCSGGAGPSAARSLYEINPIIT
jgi:hypothetical protein